MVQPLIPNMTHLNIPSSCRAGLVLLGSLVFATTASAQGFNVDFNQTGGTQPAVSASYAAAGTAGVWNPITSPTTSTPLVDKSGAASSVTITTHPTLSASLTFNNANMSGDDANLLEDIIYGGTTGVQYPITFNGLANGTYNVYTYAIAPDNKTGFITNVDVVGSLSGQQSVGGFLFTGHAQGTSYALHTVDVTSGTIVVNVSIGTSFISVNGIQIEPAGATGSSDCDCTGGNSPCFNTSGPGRGCPNSNANGLGAELTGAGVASIANDSFSLSVIDAAPSTLGLILSGTTSLGPNGVGTVANAAGVLCVTGTTLRGAVVGTNAAGAASFPDFQGAPYGAAGNVVSGSTVSYTYWFRDPGTAAGCAGDTPSSDFNFSNGWTVLWN